MQTTRVVNRFRLTGAGIVLGGLAARIALSATTYGTNDVGYFTGFARTVRELGPIGIYRVSFETPYNHPPLVGWILAQINWLTDRGLSFPFALRILPILADVAMAVLMMRIVRSRYGDRAGLVAGALVAFSPVLVLVSGVHGNIDTVFCALVLLSLFLMADKRLPVAAGVVAAVAVGIKLVPIIVIPVIALSGGSRRALARFAGASVVVSSLIWLPALIREPDGVVSNVLGYRGQYAHWGLSEIATLMGIGRGSLSSVHDTIALIATAASMALGLWYLVRTRYASPYAAAGLTLATFLFLSPAWGSQYMAWPAALLFFIGAGLAAWYSIAAGAFLVVIYSAWSGGFPFDRIQATRYVHPWGRGLGLLAWVVLGVAVAHAWTRARRRAISAAPELEDPYPAEPVRADREAVGLQAAEQPLRGGHGDVASHVEEVP